MEFDNLKVLPLHKYPEFMKECCNLINDEWPRSETARMVSLQASCDLLPTSLVLIRNNEEVVGHCKLTPIPAIPESCFIETVVISKALRGKKLGTFLMKHAEIHCRDVLKLDKVHLSTKGQEDFYAKLGYTVCAPISIYGGYAPYVKLSSDCSKKEHLTPARSAPVAGAPPPPPMPKNLNHSNQIKTKSNKTYMLKNLT